MSDLILVGVAPTDVFKRMLAAEPELRSLELGQRFILHFERVDGIAMQVITKWQAPGTSRPLSDETVDNWLLDLLRAAGYGISSLTGK